VETGDYRVADLRGGYRWQADRWTLEPFAGVSNVLDEKYMTNIRLNAAFGRYYEPAPEQPARRRAADLWLAVAANIVRERGASRTTFGPTFANLDTGKNTPG